MKRMKPMLGCVAALLSFGAAAQEEGNAWTALGERWYVTPSLSWVFTDSGRQAHDGQAVSLAIGRRFGEVFALEGFAQYDRFDHERGSDTAELIGLGIDSLFFPTRKAPAYLLLGAGYGDVSSHPGGEESYGTLLLEVGAGYWWKPFDLLFDGVSLRTQAVYRLDVHNDSRTGAAVDNGRKDFGDVVLTVGLNIPIGDVPEPPPPPAEAPVEVVVAAVPPDTDADGVADELDQCPDTPAGSAVDASGCPVVTAPKCRTPEPGEKLDLAGCGTGDVIALRGVNFEFNKDRLTANAKTILDGVDEALEASPSTNVELSGHTDGKGGDEYNLALSQRRACSVARYLERRGIDAGRMSPVGYGESKPLADDQTDEGREQNRRVELKILDGAGSGLGACPSGAETRAASTPAPTAVEAPVAAKAPPTEAPPTEVPPAAEDPAPAPSPPPSGSTESMQQVPESEVFGASSSPATPVETPTQVPESEVFGGN